MAPERTVLSRPERNEPCWCGADKKYKNCHGGIRPRSAAGEVVPPDDEHQLWLSPHVTLRRGGVRTAAGGAEMYLGDQAGEPRRYPLPPILRAELEEDHLVHLEDLAVLGVRRFEALAGLGVETDAHGIYFNGVDMAELQRFALDHALEVTVSLQSRKFEPNPPAVAYSSLTEVENTVLHCAFWATHIAVPDPLFSAMVEERGLSSVGDALRSLYELRPLIECGLVVPVPSEFVGALSTDSALRATKKDLEVAELRTWVDDQLILEGPTAREVLFMTAQDDLEEWPITRTLGTPAKFNDDGTFISRMLQPYRPDFDYSTWIAQERVNSVRHFVQEVNESVAHADFFGASYVTRSLFRANLLNRRSRSYSSEQALMWTNSPIASDIDLKTFAKAANEDDAVADYRIRMGRAIQRASTLDEAVLSAQDLQEELAAESAKLQHRLNNSRLWVSLGVGIGLGTVAVSATPLGWFLAGLGAASAVKDLLPYFEKRREAKMEAPWIWYSMRPRTPAGRRRRSR